MAQFFKNVFCEYQMCTGTTDERGTLGNSLDKATPSRPAISRSILKPLKEQVSKIKTWGDYNYTFKLQMQGTESMYQTSKCLTIFLTQPGAYLGILYADAKNGDGIPLAIRCEWLRVKGDRPYKIP